MIKGEVERLGQMETTRVLAREWVGFFVREGFGKLAELLSDENVKLDPRMCRITIKGARKRTISCNDSSIRPEQQSSSTLSSLAWTRPKLARFATAISPIQSNLVAATHTVPGASSTS